MSGFSVPIKVNRLDFLLRIDWKFISNIFKLFLQLVECIVLDSHLEVSGAVDSIFAVESLVIML